ncbi:MAG: ATP-binding protein [Terriglobia bacterium]
MSNEVLIRDFDLNIEKILEGWEASHAIREIIANALDEQMLTCAKDVTISRDGVGAWHVRDYGRGLSYRHLTENENEEKLQHPDTIIGKFGVGLKDALATLHRRGVRVRIQSRYGEISLKETAKHGFSDVITLNATISPSADLGFIGTDFTLLGVTDQDVVAAKDFFLRFSGEQVLEETRYGQILRCRPGRKARIYVTGLVVAEEERFLFSYNITSLTASMRKALNRERTNVGRTAYADRIKGMLLASESQVVAEVLADDLTKIQEGTNHDEVSWTDVAVHASQILSASKRVVFVSPGDLGASPTFGTPSVAAHDSIEHAVAEGYKVIAVPENVKERLYGLTDVKGEPVRDIEVYRREWSMGFEFKFVQENDLTTAEREVFGLRDRIAAIFGSFPACVKEISVSETMRPDFVSTSDAVGLWDPGTGRIIIKRSQLRSVDAFAGTLLHELTHADTGYGDITRGFEEGLTGVLGKVCAYALSNRSKPEKRWWNR